MGKISKIAWTDGTFNPWWGCTKVSPGCEHCYAETLGKRTGTAKWGKAEPRRFFGDKHWNEPVLWNREAMKAGERRRIFCASMADVFEEAEGLPAQRERLFNLIKDTPSLDWLLLTKRPENVNSMLPYEWGNEAEGYEAFPQNVWIGTSVENQAMASKRIPHLLHVRGPRVHFLSVEPMIGPVNLDLWLKPSQKSDYGDAWRGSIDWVICGGESGPGCRPMDTAWAIDLAKQCELTTAKFFMKQFGGNPNKRDEIMDFPKDLQIREFPE